MRRARLTLSFTLRAASSLAPLIHVGEAIGAGRHHRSVLEAERTIIDRLHDRQALIVVDEAHHLRDKLLDELRCCSARRLDADRRDNVLIPFDSRGSNNDAEQHPDRCCTTTRRWRWRGFWATGSSGAPRRSRICIVMPVPGTASVVPARAR